MYICTLVYPYPTSHRSVGVFDISKHETTGYKLAFQPDIFDMISACHSR